MRTDPPFNIDNPFSSPWELKPVSEIEKARKPDLRDKKDDSPEKGEKRKKEEEKYPPKNDPTGNLGGNLDVSG